MKTLSNNITNEKVDTPSNNPLQLSLIRKRKLAEGAYELAFRLGKKKFQFNPGQYIHVTIPQLVQHDPRGNGRDFSIASSPNEQVLRIVFRNAESGFKKTLLEAQKIQAEISGPFGVFTLPEDAKQPLVFIAGGIGVTPFLSMTQYVTEQALPYGITLIYVNKNQESIAYGEKLESLAKENPNLRLKQQIGRLNQETLLEHIKNINNPLFYIAGPPDMVTDTKNLLIEAGIPIASIKLEEFSGYKEEFGTFRNNGLMDISPIAAFTEKKILGEGIEGELAKRSLSDLEALLQALNNTAIVSETNAQGNITFVNDKFVEISKYPKDELIGQNHRILKSGFHSRAFYENMWATITRGTLWRGQMKNKAKDGSFYWVDTSIAPIIADGKPIKYISVRFPITERQLAEEQLQERAKQQNVLTALSQEALADPDLTSLLNTATNLLAQTLNVDFCLIEKLLPDGKNFTYEAGTGWSNASKGKTCISAGTTESMAGFTLASKEPVVVEELTIESRFAGSPILHDHNVVSGLTVIIHGTERPFGILGIFTNKKRTFSQEDINFVQAVANLLANAARNHLDKRKDEFLGLASHEMRTPLTSIKTFTQLLQKHAKKQQDEHSSIFLTKIDTQLNKLTDLIGDLLDISRINTGKLEYSDESFKLSELVEEIVEEQQLITNKHKITVENGVNNKVYGDRNRIGQVVTNLVSNAIKYSPDDDKIFVKTYKEGDRIVVCVKDHGVGIPKDELPHVFDRFYRGDGKKKDEFPGGLGLGLYLCSEIVKRYQGQIWAESKEGKGSTFFFSLPSRGNGASFPR